MRTMKRNRKGGFIVTAELILIATVLVIGLLVGMAEVRDSLVAELDDVADAFGAVSQTYVYQGVSQVANGAANATDGSAYLDTTDDGVADSTFGGDTVEIVTTRLPDTIETVVSLPPPAVP